MGFEAKSLMSPCFFGVTLQQGTQLIALLNMVIGIWFCVIFTLYCLMVGIGGADAEVETVVIIFWVMIVIILTVSTVTHFLLLFKGAAERSPKKIKIYLIVTLVLVVLGMVASLTRHLSFSTLLIGLLSNLPIFYQLWVVFCFFKEISNVDQYNGGPQFQEP